MTIRTAMAGLLQCRGRSRPPGTPDSTARTGLPGLSRKDSDQSAYEATSYHDNILDVDERREIARILPYLDASERVLVVARQSRVHPGATLVFTPDVIFCTDRRTIIRNPMMLGLREHVDFYRHRDVKSARLVRGRFTSSLMLTVPGMGTAARSASGEGDGIISAIPHAKAEEIYRIIQRGGDGKRRRTRGKPDGTGGAETEKVARDTSKGRADARQDGQRHVAVQAEAGGGVGTA